MLVCRTHLTDLSCRGRRRCDKVSLRSSVRARPFSASVSVDRHPRRRRLERLVDRGVSSEKYNEKTYDRREDASEAETPPPFWVKRFYGGGGGLRSLFPSRGQKLGAQLDRNASVNPKGRSARVNRRARVSWSTIGEWTGERPSISAIVIRATIETAKTTARTRLSGTWSIRAGTKGDIPA